MIRRPRCTIIRPNSKKRLLPSSPFVSRRLLHFHPGFYQEEECGGLVTTLCRRRRHVEAAVRAKCTLRGEFMGRGRNWKGGDGELLERSYVHHSSVLVCRWRRRGATVRDKNSPTKEWKRVIPSGSIVGGAEEIIVTRRLITPRAAMCNCSRTGKIRNREWRNAWCVVRCERQG